MPTSSCRRNSYCLFSMTVIVVAVTSSVVGQDSKPSRQPAIVLGSSVHVSADNPKAPHVESFLALNPKNPSELVASSIVYGETRAGVDLSGVAGASWGRVTSFG